MLYTLLQCDVIYNNVKCYSPPYLTGLQCGTENFFRADGSIQSNCWRACKNSKKKKRNKIIKQEDVEEEGNEEGKE